MTLGLADRVRRLPRPARVELYQRLVALGPGALATRRYDWEGFWARPDQIVTAAERRSGLVIFTGPRGSGKTCAAVRYWVGEILAGRAQRPRVVAAKEADIAGVVVNGPSGIKRWLPPHVRARTEWVPSSDDAPAGVIRFPNGVQALCFSARDPESTVAWEGDLDLYDDVAKWGVHAERTWKHARTSCRAGRGQGVVATTRRGTHLLRKLLASGDREDVVIKRPPTTRANRANLTPGYFEKLAAELGEIDGNFLAEELEDEELSAASTFAGLEFEQPPIRVSECRREELVETVVVVDPSEGKGGDHDEWGIGAAGKRRDRHVVALEDRSGSYDDPEAGAVILDLCEQRGAAKIVVETNRGPRVRAAIRAAHLTRELDALRADPNARARPMPEIVGVTAREGKKLRAGPVRTLYLDGLLHHLPGLGLLERQMRQWDPDGPRRPRTDDRIDWLVHAAHHLADLGAAPAPDPLETARAASAGLREANEGMPPPAWGGDLV